MEVLNKESEVLRLVKSLKALFIKPAGTVDEIISIVKEIYLHAVTFIKLVEQLQNEKDIPNEQYFSVIVYLMHCGSLCELFKDSFSRYLTEREMLLEIKRCLCKQLILVLDNIDLVLHPIDDRSINSFVNLMDIGLDKISELNSSKSKIKKHKELSMISYIIEEILCLAMSVAQVAVDNSNKIITGSCHSVLNALENLKTEVCQEIPNSDMCKLLTDTCTDTLCSLEIKINTAVLYICLKVFSNYKSPMKDLYNYCKQENNANKSPNNLISEFDLHMDRIFQICTFSIASSSMGKYVAEIKTIMSNLKFLETEMVPAFLRICNNPLMNKFADILKTLWCRQMKLLRKAVHKIVEPTAYSKMVYGILDQEADRMWQDICNGSDTDMSSINNFILYIKELGKMFTECLDSFENKDDVREQLKIVYKVLNELIMAKDLSGDLNNVEIKNRIFKRCKILLVTIERLQKLTTIEAASTNSSIEEFTRHDNTNIFHENNISVEHTNAILLNITAKSKELLKDRNTSHLNEIFTYKNILRENTKGNGSYLIRNSKLREYSYCRNKTALKFEEFSIADAVTSYLDTPDFKVNS